MGPMLLPKTWVQRAPHLFSVIRLLDTLYAYIHPFWSIIPAVCRYAKRLNGDGYRFGSDAAAVGFVCGSDNPGVGDS